MILNVFLFPSNFLFCTKNHLLLLNSRSTFEANTSCYCCCFRCLLHSDWSKSTLARFSYSFLCVFFAPRVFCQMFSLGHIDFSHLKCDLEVSFIINHIFVVAHLKWWIRFLFAQFFSSSSLSSSSDDLRIGSAGSDFVECTHSQYTDTILYIFFLDFHHKLNICTMCARVCVVKRNFQLENTHLKHKIAHWNCTHSARETEKKKKSN